MFDVLDIDGREAAEKYHLGPLSSKLIAGSDLKEEQIQELLHPDIHLSTSKAICVLKACQRILQARDNHEKVFVAGDYDADGITSTAIMKATLDKLGISNGYYIPDRFKEGYGLKPHTVEMVKERGYSLIITVDNGVKAHDALKKARQLGIDVIVTDHHVIEEEIESDIVVHPQYMEEQFDCLSGAGVALEISRNLIGNVDDLNTFAGVAAIGDVMPLWRETRKLVLFAIHQLQHGKPRSLSALLYKGAYVDESAIAFSIVPKLNALSRMSEYANVNTVVNYLLCHDEVQIDHYAAQLNALNDMRKKLSTQETADARTKINDDPFQIIYDPSYHVGICGLVAGRICEEIQKPVLVLTDYNDVLKGSGRSVKGFDMFSFLSDIPGKTEFGGHEMACGISIQKDCFEDFRTEVQNRLSRQEIKLELEDRKSILIHSEDVTFENIVDLQKLSPFPKEMLQPVFTLRHPVVSERRETAKTIRYHIDNSHGGFDASVFVSRGTPAPQSPEELTGRLAINRWNHRISCQMMVDDAK